jgi:hypothetical protein
MYANPSDRPKSRVPKISEKALRISASPREEPDLPISKFMLQRLGELGQSNPTLGRVIAKLVDRVLTESQNAQAAFECGTAIFAIIDLIETQMDLDEAAKL